MTPHCLITRFFTDLDDPRLEPTRFHHLMDLVVIALVCGHEAKLIRCGGKQPWSPGEASRDDNPAS